MACSTPTTAGKPYSRAITASTVGELATVASSEACSSSSPCSAVTLSGAPALADWIGFADPAQTLTSARTDVSNFDGSKTINVAPTAANGTSYYDGCMWENRNISVTGNSFEVDPAQFNATPAPEGGSAWNCVTGPKGNCAQNAMGYQYPGGNAAPYNDVTLANAMMSAPTLPAPFDNLNGSGSPSATGSNGDVGPNGAAPYNNLWSGNTYAGNWTFQAYSQAADCPLNWTGSVLQWVGGGGNACSGLSVAQWNAIWHQD